MNRYESMGPMFKKMSRITVMRKFGAIITLILLSVFIFSCGKDNDDTDPEIWYTIERSNTFSGIAPEVFLVDTPGNVNLTYTLDLGSNTRDVYFIFTNTTMTDASSNPVVQNTYALSAPSFADVYADNRQSDYVASVYETNTIESATGLRGKPEITEFNRDPFGHIQAKTTSNKSLLRSITVSGPSYDFVESKDTFYDDMGNTISATCRNVTSNGSVTLNVWVANDTWFPCLKYRCVNQSMIDELAKKFLDTSTNNDIYNWVTTIFGVEWGSHKYPSQLISDTNEITILLYDIDGDGNLPPTGPVALGFFYSRDNFFRSIYEYSNERIMFYLDAVLYAIETDTIWEISDDWPAEIISTLAHEFQHMIHFYQKTVLRVPKGAGTETWLNELLSLSAEDLVASKIEVDGPRGIAFNDPTGGAKNNTSGRLPLYNYYNYESLVNWYPHTDTRVTRNYSINYAFGAYLARAFGGAPFMRNLLLNQYTDYRAVDYALQNSGYPGENFASVMRKWAAANLLSDTTTLSQPMYQYNSGTWFESDINTVDYFLGSINLYNYKYSVLTGPRIFTSSPVGPGTQQPGASNYYFLVDTGLTGEITKTITMEEEIKLTVVVK